VHGAHFAEFRLHAIAAGTFLVGPTWASERQGARFKTRVEHFHWKLRQRHLVRLGIKLEEDVHYGIRKPYFRGNLGVIDNVFADLGPFASAGKKQRPGGEKHHRDAHDRAE